MRYLLKTILTPRCWLQNYPFSAAWDEKLSQLLDSRESFTDINEYTARIGGYLVWIANHPYASFTTYGGRPQFRPRRSTILRAHDWLADCVIRAKG